MDIPLNHAVEMPETPLVASPPKTTLHPSVLLILSLTCLYIATVMYRSKPRRQVLSDGGTATPPQRLSQMDPFLGLDTVVKSYDKLRSHEFLQTCQARFAEAGNTYVASMLGSDLIATCEPDNVKALLATQYADFELGSRRKNAFNPLLGHSIFASDGPLWKEARQLLRPSFAKGRVTDVHTFEAHAAALVRAVHIRQSGGALVDLQDLFFRLSLDVATEFFFGESCASLLAAADDASPAARFADAFNRSQQTIVDDFVLGPVASSYPHLQFARDQATVLAFARGYVDRATAAAAEHEAAAAAGAAEGGAEERVSTSILEDLAKQISDPDQLRDQALSLLVAGRDTTASLLSNLFFILSRRPDVWAALQAEVGALQGRRPEVGELKDMTYLQACLRESLRLHPPVPVNIRQAVRDTTLPRGGGPDGQSPISIPNGALISYCVFAMHRREDIWGHDADIFRPERWSGKKAGWEWLPFNGGPRICLGQQLALAEAGYTTVRILQEFPRIRAKDDSPWQEHLTLTCCVEGGVNVRLE